MSAIEVFNKRHVRQRRARARAGFSRHRFLHDWACGQMIERLKDLRRDFPVAISLGNNVAPDFYQDLKELKQVERLFIADPAHADIVIDFEALPFADQSADLVLSVLDLHQVNDLPGSLAQIKRILKPDGFFIACIFGGETLYELREALLQTEIEESGGASPRVAPFADKPQMGELLQRAGFSLPVIDSEILTVSYQTMFNLLGDLRGMGQSNMLAKRIKTFTPASFFARAADYYQRHFPDIDTRVKASFEIIFLSGWAPHESQQKPLRRGSGQTHLSEILET